VQVGTPPSLNCKRSNNAFLLLLPSPSVLLSVTADCVRVAKLLLMCGDVEENLGPTDGTDVTTLSDELRTVIKSITSHVDSRHDELKKVLDEVKSTQTKLEKTVSDINSRLAAVEGRVNLLDENQEVQVHQVVTDTVRVETAEIRSRLDNFEDWSRKDNLIFYGLEDTAEESWAESEEKVRALISASLESVIPEDSISRAHRLGAYVPKKCRPVIVKLCSFKMRDVVPIHNVVPIHKGSAPTNEEPDSKHRRGVTSAGDLVSSGSGRRQLRFNEAAPQWEASRAVAQESGSRDSTRRHLSGRLRELKPRFNGNGAAPQRRNPVVVPTVFVGTDAAPATASVSSITLEGAEGMDIGGPASASPASAPPVPLLAYPTPAAVAAQTKGPRKAAKSRGPGSSGTTRTTDDKMYVRPLFSGTHLR
ncbi:uncharacterized protein LOC144175438, partial [Haemaphysalis longicornis]